MTVKGILRHSSGANNPNLKRYVQPSDIKPTADTFSPAEWLEVLGTNKNKIDWNHIKHNVGVNGWIGKLANGGVTSIQSLPWDFRPWGCGSGSKGSCNDGWIQFEICEDGLTSQAYFNKVYEEACELTAYLCQLYNIDPNGTATLNGVKVPTITCHQDAHKLGLASNHGDVNHWFPKFGKSMDTARADVAALLNATKATKVLYRVRKSQTDVSSQKGAFSVLANAIKACQDAGEGYHVFDQNWKIVYSYEAPVVKITLSSIAVTKLPTKTSYLIGESFDATGLTVAATYSDKSTKLVTDYKLSGFDSTKAGTVTVTITFEDKTVTFTLDVKEETKEEPTKPINPKPEDNVEPENTPAITPNKDSNKPAIDTNNDLDEEQLDNASDNLTKLIFECLKKLVQILVNIFNK
jgi:hypothetical protein